LLGTIKEQAIITGGSKRRGETLDTVFVYDKETMETEKLPSMIQVRQSHAAVIVRGNLYVIGGQDTDGRNSATLDTIEVLDLNDPQEWKRLPVRLEKKRFHCSAVVANEHEIYIIGGCGYNFRARSSVEILNVSTNMVSQGPSLLNARFGFSAVFLRNSIVVAGGSDSQIYTLLSCEKLLVSQDVSRWQPLGCDMSIVRTFSKGLAF
jgi:hypothetical protein